MGDTPGCSCIVVLQPFFERVGGLFVQHSAMERPCLIPKGAQALGLFISDDAGLRRSAFSLIR